MCNWCKPPRTSRRPQALATDLETALVDLSKKKQLYESTPAGGCTFERRGCITRVDVSWWMCVAAAQIKGGRSSKVKQELLDAATRALNTEFTFMEMAVRMERKRVADMKARPVALRSPSGQWLSWPWHPRRRSRCGSLCHCLLVPLRPSCKSTSTRKCSCTAGLWKNCRPSPS